MAAFWPTWRRDAPKSRAEYEKEIEQLRRKAPIPAIWLFGKTGSGKSSIVRYLTGADAAIIGEGFRPETKTSRRFDFPDSPEPLLTFIDTRGLGEASYDPADDIARFADATQLVVVTARVTDQALQMVVDPLRRIRKASPHRPMILALTCLHEATAGSDLSSGPDPFAAASESTSQQAVTAHSATTHSATSAHSADSTHSAPSLSSPSVASAPVATTTAKPDAAVVENAKERAIPTTLQTLIDEKRRQFEGLVDAVIPIDLTKPSDGFADPNFGGPRLKQAILEHLPHAYRQALLTLNGDGRRESLRQKKTRWQVLASSALAASAGAVPVPWVDIPVVLGLQAHLAIRIAAIYDQEITPSDWAVLSSIAGSRIVFRMALLEALKFIPLWGMAAGAASSFAFTYALGMSWEWYFAHTRGDKVPSAAQLKEIFKEQLKRGHELWRAE
ncbi:MAG: GTPase [Aureliella sp.]